MLLGRISGRVTTKRFGFRADARVRKLDYLAVKDSEGKWILAIADSVVTIGTDTHVKARIIGYRDRRGFLKTPTVPFAPETPVFSAENDFISETLGIDHRGLYIGLLEGYEIKVHLPVEHLIKKHIAVLAKTGAGKSYAAGVVLEELLENEVPVVVIDPHGEYSSLRRQNTNRKELRFAERFGIKSKSYKDSVNIFRVKGGKQIKLNSRLSVEDIVKMLPTSVSGSQKGILYSVIKNLSGREGLRFSG